MTGMWLRACVATEYVGRCAHNTEARAHLTRQVSQGCDGRGNDRGERTPAATGRLTDPAARNMLESLGNGVQSLAPTSVPDRLIVSGFQKEEGAQVVARALFVASVCHR